MISYFRGNGSQCPHQGPMSLRLVRATSGAAHSNQDHRRKLACEGAADRGEVGCLTCARRGERKDEQNLEGR